ncbi:MAG: aminoacyl-tRNA deacylase [Candidatus Aenigmatarchaeota archaeon]
MDLKKYLEEKGIWHRFIDKPKPTRHTLEAAELTGLDPERITKSLVLLDEKNNPYIVIIPGNKKLDFKKVKSIFNLKKVHLAPLNEAKNYSGYEPGETPPLHYLNIKKVGIDKNLLKYDTIFGGGGNKNLIIEIKTQDIIKENKAVIGDFIEQ